MNKGELNDNTVKKASTDLAVTLVDAVVNLVIPVSPIQIGVSMFKLYSSIKEESFSKKMKLFISQSKRISQAEKNKFVARLGKEKSDFFKRIWLLIDRLDEDEKAEIIGRLFKALIKNQVSTDRFLRIVSMVEKTYIEDIRALRLLNKTKESKFIASKKKIMVHTWKNLASIGFISEIPSHNKIQPPETEAYTNSRFEFSSYGLDLTKFGFK